jgi:hypothetical protein
LVREATALPDVHLDRFLGRLLSEPKAHLLTEVGGDWTVADVMQRLEKGDGVVVHPACRALFIGEDSEVLLFVAGEEFAAPRDLALRLTEGSAAHLRDLSPSDQERSVTLLVELLCRGYASLVPGQRSGATRSK